MFPSSDDKYTYICSTLNLWPPNPFNVDTSHIWSNDLVSKLNDLPNLTGHNRKQLIVWSPCHELWIEMPYISRNEAFPLYVIVYYDSVVLTGTVIFHQIYVILNKLNFMTLNTKATSILTGILSLGILYTVCMVIEEVIRPLQQW